MMQVDQISAPLPSYMTRDLVALFESATDAQVARGRDWYPAARRWAANLADETGLTVAQVVAILAITSPGAQLVTNLEWTERVARQWHRARTSHRGSRYARVGRFPNAMAPKLRNVLRDPAAAEAYVTGPKVSAFHRAILGDDSALVIDRWAFRAATGSPDLNLLRPTLRTAVESAYERAAAIVGEPIRAFQAVVWIALRESTPNGRSGTVHRLRDIDAFA